MAQCQPDAAGHRAVVPADDDLDEAADRTRRSRPGDEVGESCQHAVGVSALDDRWPVRGGRLDRTELVRVDGIVDERQCRSVERAFELGRLDEIRADDGRTRTLIVDSLPTRNEEPAGSGLSCWGLLGIEAREAMQHLKDRDEADHFDDAGRWESPCRVQNWSIDHGGAGTDCPCEDLGW